MYNAVNKMVLGAIVIASCVAMTSCGDKEKEGATKLLSEAQECYEHGRSEEALSLIDSLDKTYPKQIEIRRKGMHFKPKIIEKQTLTQLATVDSLSAVLAYKCDSLKNTMGYVDHPIEGYYTAKCIEGKVPSSESGLYPRMTHDGMFYLIESNKKMTGSTGVTISCNGVSVTSATVPNDGERNDRSRGVELITFMPAESDTLGKMISEWYPAKIQLTFDGGKSYSIDLPSVQAQAISETYTVAKYLAELGRVTREKSRLEKQLDLARSQMARTFDDSNIVTSDKK